MLIRIITTRKDTEKRNKVTKAYTANKDFKLLVTQHQITKGQEGIGCDACLHGS